jgi:hypothetical protein
VKYTVSILYRYRYWFVIAEYRYRYGIIANISVWYWLNNDIYQLSVSVWYNFKTDIGFGFGLIWISKQILVSVLYKFWKGVSVSVLVSCILVWPYPYRYRYGHIRRTLSHALCSDQNCQKEPRSYIKALCCPNLICIYKQRFYSNSNCTYCLYVFPDKWSIICVQWQNVKTDHWKINTKQIIVCI